MDRRSFFSEVVAAVVGVSVLAGAEMSVEHFTDELVLPNGVRCRMQNHHGAWMPTGEVIRLEEIRCE